MSLVKLVPSFYFDLIVKEIVFLTFLVNILFLNEKTIFFLHLAASLTVFIRSSSLWQSLRSLQGRREVGKVCSTYLCYFLLLLYGSS